MFRGLKTTAAVVAGQGDRKFLILQFLPPQRRSTPTVLGIPYFRDSSENGAGPDSPISSLIPQKERVLKSGYWGRRVVSGDSMVCLLPGYQRRAHTAGPDAYSNPRAAECQVRA